MISEVKEEFFASIEKTLFFIKPTINESSSDIKKFKIKDLF